MLRSSALAALAFIALVVAAYAPDPAPGRASDALPAPDTSRFVNLQVFPDDIPEEALLAAMRTFAGSLGVRCDYCHAGDGEGLDFPSDAKPEKEIARAMMRMTREINEDELAEVEGLHHPVDVAAGPAGWPVTCWTCHRGNPHPEAHVPATEGPPRDGPAPTDSTHDGGEGEVRRHDDGGPGHTHVDSTGHHHDDGSMRRHDERP